MSARSLRRPHLVARDTANQLRLWLASLAYVLVSALRRVGLAGTRLADATCGTICLKLLKIGALVKITVRRVQGNRISKLRQQFREIGVIPTGLLDLSAQRAFRSLFLDGVQGHVSQDRQIVRGVAQAGCPGLRS